MFHLAVNNQLDDVYLFHLYVPMNYSEVFSYKGRVPFSQKGSDKLQFWRHWKVHFFLSSLIFSNLSKWMVENYLNNQWRKYIQVNHNTRIRHLTNDAAIKTLMVGKITQLYGKVFISKISDKTWYKNVCAATLCLCPLETSSFPCNEPSDSRCTNGADMGRAMVARLGLGLPLLALLLPTQIY